MSTTDMNANAELAIPRELRAAIQEGVKGGDEDGSTRVNAPRSVLRSALDALSDGRIPEAVEHFDEVFKFNDHGLVLEFTTKRRLTEFFQKARELFPDSALEVVSLLESGDHAIAEWKLTATQTVGYGSISYQLPISLFGSTIVRVEHGRIVQWSDYYDHASSRRNRLAAFFTEWIEY